MDFSVYAGSALECSICLERVQQATSVKSGKDKTDCHFFCHECIQQHMERAGEQNRIPLCPKCNRQIEAVFKNPALDQILDELEKEVKLRKQADAKLANAQHHLENQLQQRIDDSEANYKVKTAELEAKYNKMTIDSERRRSEAEHNANKQIAALQSQVQFLTNNVAEEQHSHAVALQAVKDQHKDENAKLQHENVKLLATVADLTKQLDNVKQDLRVAIQDTTRWQKTAQRIVSDQQQQQHQHQHQQQPHSQSQQQQKQHSKDGQQQNASSWLSSLIPTAVGAYLWDDSKAAQLKGRLVLQASEFQIKERLGENKTSRVWKAVYQSSTTCVVKKIGNKQMQLRECMILNLLHHPNIIELTGVTSLSTEATSSRSLFMVLPFVKQDLALFSVTVLLHQKARAKVVQLIALQLLRALRYLHSVDLVHRNISLTNILIDSQFDVKLTGFGSCTSIHNPSLELVPVPTVYSSPELIMYEDQMQISAQMWKSSDVFAVGVVLYRLTADKPLFSSISRRDMLQGLVNYHELAPTNLDSESPPLLGQCMAQRKHKSFVQELSSVNSVFVDLLLGLLTLDGKRRMSAESALLAPVFQNFDSASVTVSPHLKRKLTDDNIDAFAQQNIY